MKFVHKSNFLLGVVLIFSTHIGFAQNKNGKSVKKSKELIQCEQQRDSLSAIIVTLEQEKKDLNAQIELFTEKNADLSKKLESSAQLYATNISISNFKSGKGIAADPASKAKDVDKTIVEFDFMDNENAKAGPKTLYLVIFDSKGKIAYSQDKKFKTIKEGKELLYALEKNFDYKKKADKQKLTVKYDKKFQPGKYKIELYTDGYLSGGCEFQLD